MIFVAPATGLAGHYPMLGHAEWNGITIGDLVFPSFLVTSGLSLSFLLRAPLVRATYARLIRRLLALIVLGLAYNAYGDTWLDLSDLRFTGVLQMIGISGACAAFLILIARKWSETDRVGLLIGIATAMLVAYGIGLYSGSCGPAGRCSVYSGIDAALLGASHLYRGGQAGFDPEGIMASLAATAFVLFGFSAGTMLQRHGSLDFRKVLMGVGALVAYCLASGLALSLWMLPNKRLMTPAFVMFTTAIALAAFGIIYLLMDARSDNHSEQRNRRWVWLSVALGRNALVVYLLERMLYQTAKFVHFGDRSVQTLLLDDFLPFGIPRAHLIYSGIVLVIILGVTGTLHRRRAYWAL
ncbi:hypothetical protein [Candidatus Poriferisodalis sp.]|uniref:hypothetical protein n=1 Tax=Candidatus Poriferisodalis sp. TaxID=3101277 RepID=UPI003B0225F9